ncbi:Thioredoxin domain-containing protein [Paludibacter propionicigenes WB4]|uniref:Thioredoxin domain-containing protein n=1 Tax=Paludibacter propionicigenes (strain DSM 17365 / JCM 13257 / WB4) TaxID=694427 RepID=E4T6V0_PALPW|nr:thioredoxin fold domain-containing protein [Paludibacter propionicigenes]ADQ80444.1 Thioredoxin domain-containing protein [Paludibacter propionicigenes WB4]
MKKQLLIVSTLFIAISSFAQGIVFEQGTWKQVLEKAKQTNKPIFVDVYTTWCGPCKKMSKEIFPLAEVGAVYNANFVCYQIDAEKGEGIDFAKKYEVKAYPTYVFIKPDGTLFSRALGSMPAKDFINVATVALADLSDPKPIEEWDKEYATRKNETAFLLGYMDKRSKLGKPNDQLFDEYLQLIPEEELTSDIVIKKYINDGQQMKVNSYAYENLLKNRTKYFAKLFGYTDLYLMAGVVNTMREAAKLKDDQLLEKAIKAYDQLPGNTLQKQRDEIYMEYYQRTENTNKYQKYATGFCNNYLMKISKDSIDKKDQLTLQLIENQIKSGALAKIDSVQLAQLRQYSAHAVRDKISEALNNVAWKFFETVSDKKALNDALSWSKRSLEIYPENPMWMDTYANLLYKLGKNEEAVAMEEEALELVGKDSKEGFKNTLQKMREGQKTWN